MKNEAGPGRTLALGPGAEFDRIREIIQTLGPHASGLGDDCALFPAGDTFFALSTDVSVEGIHFRLDWISLEEAGWRAAAAALSDLAAEGARPLGLLSAVTMPDSAAQGDLLQLMNGVGAAAASVGATVSGGDLSSGGAWSIAVTVIGETSRPVTRAGASPGDALWVTGALGGSRAGLEAWRRGAEPAPEARRRYAHPEPRVGAGQWLARHGARAMLDLSDGLGGDAAHLAAASAVTVEIDLGLLPVALEVKPEADRLGQSSQRFAAEAGEDFELLAALPPEFDGAGEFARACGIPLTRIGTIRAGKGVRCVLEGKAVEIRGYDHFG
ncbi:MAG TPA: thiamine-phosphate kinase [Gemmatimonadales bacterium]